MKNLILILFSFIISTSYGQIKATIELSDKQDVYLFFPSKVVHQKLSSANSAIQIKSDPGFDDMIYLKTDKVFQSQDILSIITENKERYYLTIVYSSTPKANEYDFTKANFSSRTTAQETPIVSSSNEKEEKKSIKSNNNSPIRNSDQVCKLINSKYKRGSIHGGNGSRFGDLRMEMYVKGIYYYKEKTYIQVLVIDKSKAPFIMDRDISFSVVENVKVDESYPLQVTNKCQEVNKLKKGQNWFIYEFDKVSTTGNEPLVVNLSEERKGINNVNLRSLRIETQGSIFSSAKVLN